MRASTNISLKSRKQLTLNNFLGVDATTSKFLINGKRASYMRNLEFRDGCNHKRHGYSETITQWLSRLLKDDNIYGLSKCKQINSSGDTIDLFTICTNKNIYQISKKNAYNYDFQFLNENVPKTVLDYTDVDFFYNGDKLYIVGGNEILVGSSDFFGWGHKFKTLSQCNDAYVPMTTASINEIHVEDTARATIEPINLLTPLRKNGLVGCKRVGEYVPSWKLDGKIELSDASIKDFSITIKTVDKKNNNITIEGVLKNQEGAYLILNKYTKTTIGEIDQITYENSSIILFIDTEPQETQKQSGEDNIIITYRAVINNYNIFNSRIGTMFGVNGVPNRLILSGAKNNESLIFCSQMNDFTYFPDTLVQHIGSTNSKIIGIGRFSDDTLIIYKDAQEQKSNIFYMNAEYKDIYDTNKELENVELVFHVHAMGINETLISKGSIANLGGDSLMLSQNGLFGAVIINNITTNERALMKRSYTIDNLLKKHSIESLKNAKSIVYKDKYYLHIDGTIYVADRNYRYNNSNSSSAFNYEFWVWDNINVSAFAIIDNELWFASKDEKDRPLICKFCDQFYDSHYDKYFFEFRSGESNVGHPDKVFGEPLKNNDIGVIRWLYCEVFLSLLEDAKAKDNYIYSTNTLDFGDIHEHMEIYFDIYTKNIKKYIPYYIGEVDHVLSRFKVFKDSELKEQLTLDISESFCVFQKPFDKQFKYHDENDEQYFTNEKGEKVVFFCYGDYSSFYFCVPHQNNITAEWYSGIFDMGSNVYSKTLLWLTISTDPNITGNVSFGYETSNTTNMHNYKTVGAFSFDDLSFENFSFECGFASSYTIKTLAKDFNYIMFRYISNDDCDCAVNDITATYKINKMNKGVS